MTPPNGTPTVFISYAHADERWLKQLVLHLRPMHRAGQIASWSDQAIGGGADWRRDIETAIRNAIVAVLLVSPRFLASEFIVDHELPPLLERARRKAMHLIPLLISPSRFESLPELSWLQAANPPGRELSRLRGPERDAVLVKLSLQIEGAVTLSALSEPTYIRGAGRWLSPDALTSHFTEGTGFVRCVSARKQARSSKIDPGAKLFGDLSRQWVVIIGTKPSWLEKGRGTAVEAMDATRVLDRFSSAEFSAIPYTRIVFCTESEATAAAVRTMLATLAKDVGALDSVLFFYAGHTTQGHLALHDFAPPPSSKALPHAHPGAIAATELIVWANALSARQVLMVLDGGGDAFYAAAARAGANRVVISALECRYVLETGILTWYLCRALAEIGPDITVADLLDILLTADRQHARPMRFYVRTKSVATTA